MYTLSEYEASQSHLKMAAALVLPACGGTLACQASAETARRWKAPLRWAAVAHLRHAPMCLQMPLVPALAQSSISKAPILHWVILWRRAVWRDISFHNGTKPLSTVL